ncbi:MAG: 50S ribosomal protein L29 [Mariprofundaceae bacterium]
MKAVELRKLTDADLNVRMEELAAEHMKLRFQKATMQLTNSARIGQVRKEVARIQTILAQR